MVVGELKTWNPRFFRMGCIHWTILVAKYKVHIPGSVEWAAEAGLFLAD